MDSEAKKEIQKLAKDFLAKVFEYFDVYPEKEDTSYVARKSFIQGILQKELGISPITLDAVEAKHPEVAIMLYMKVLSKALNDGKHEDINSLKEVYTVNIINGAIKKVYKDEFKSYNHLPVFASWNEALEAKDALKPLFEKVYGRKQED